VEFQPRPAPLLAVAFFSYRLRLPLKTALGLFLFPTHFISLHSLPFLAPFFFPMFIPSLIAALGFAVSSASAQQPGSFVVVGDTLVSAMMVCPQLDFC
jgi:hypothetical protein